MVNITEILNAKMRGFDKTFSMWWELIYSVVHVYVQLRLAQLRNVKRQASTTPLIDMKKSGVEKQRLSQYIVMPKDLELSFKTWWKSLSNTSVVQVRYPYKHHGNTIRESNSSKRTVRDEFLIFFYANNQSNGGSADSSGQMLSGFTTIQTPQKNVANYDERLWWSVVGEFNRVQSGNGKGGCSNGSASNWLSQYRPKVAICPHKLDYCDTCEKFDNDIRAKQTTSNRLRHVDSSSEEELKSVECILQNLQSAQTTQANSMKVI